MMRRVGMVLAVAVALAGCESGAGTGETSLTDTAGADGEAGVADGHAAQGCVESGCDDNLSCTIGSCDEATGQCSWGLLPKACVIGGVCRTEGERHPHDACRQCAPTLDPWVWSPVEETDCDSAPGDEPKDGEACDDGDPCTLADQFQAGVCAGTPRTCPDEGPCLVGVCDPDMDGVCTLAPAENACDDGDACTADDQCVDGACVAGTPLLCDDGNPCTIEHCDTFAGCTHLPIQSPCCVGTESVCEDGNPCTDDLCDPATAACEYVPNTAPCDDGSDCTVDDVCAETTCGGQPKDCDDANDCTEDYCVPGDGCVTVPLDAVPCDDGLSCSTGDACVEGVCEADKTDCVCEVDPEMDVTKVTELSLGSGGHPGEALDVDGDPSTCAPAADCSGGIDNALGLLSSFANEAIQEAVQEGDVALIVSFEGYETGSFLLSVYEAKPVGWDCDWQTQPCYYNLTTESVDPITCVPHISLDATVEGNVITAGGPGYLFPFSLPLSAGVSLQVIVHDTQLHGTFETGPEGVVSFDGVVGGAIPKDALMAAIDSLPDEGLPVDKALIQAVMDAVETDVDTDGDGVGDASSIGFKLSGIDGFVAGFQD